MTTYQERRRGWSKEYAAYHDRVVEAFVMAFGPTGRQFWLENCDFQDEFQKNMDPADIARNQLGVANIGKF